MEEEKLEQLVQELQLLLGKPFKKETEKQHQTFISKVNAQINDMDKAYQTPSSQLAVSMSL